MHPSPLTRPFILASQSPRRAALLRQIGLAFHALPAHLDEAPPIAGEEVREWAMRIAAEKAAATAHLLPADEKTLILGADTVVVVATTEPGTPCLQGQPVQVLGKPRDADDARRMLEML
ncbi:MAG TPA: Maf family protein, partial [Armatimonadota bacterium]